MHFTLADLHHYVRPSDRALLDQIEMRAAEAKAREIENLVRNCMARKPPEPEAVTGQPIPKPLAMPSYSFQKPA